MNMDFNTAEGNSFDLIPVGTVAPLIMTIRPGQAGDGGWLTQSRSSDYAYLNCEFAVTDGPFKGRKFWGNLMASHPDPENKAVNITRSTLRAILESARGINPTDDSEAAKAKRIVSGFGDFSGMEFVGKIGIEKGGEGYEDKNKLVAAIPVTSPEYAKAKAPANSAAPAASTPAPSGGAVPAWAQ